MLIPTVGLREVSERKFNTTHLTSNQETWFHPVWYRKYQHYFYPVQILRSHRFILIPTYKMHPAGAIFEFAVSPKYYLQYKYSTREPTTHNTHIRTTKMDHWRPTLQWLCPLSPWVGQRHQQLMAPPLPMGPYKARAIGLGGAAVGSPVWGTNTASPIKNKEEGGALALGGCRSSKKSQQSTASRQKRYGGC
jgi:hypothetical protein